MKNFYSFVALCIVMLCTSQIKLNAAATAPLTTTECCTNNMIQNGSFENSLDFWDKTGTGSWASNSINEKCGGKTAVSSGNTTLSQKVQVAPGTKLTATVYAGYTGSGAHTLKMAFYDINGVRIGNEVVKNVTNTYTTNNNSPLILYSFSEVTAPAKVSYVLFSADSDDGTLKIDAACIQFTFVPAPDCNCDNVLTNGSFEDNTTLKGWKTTGGATWQYSEQYKACGDNGVVLGNTGTLYQDVPVIAGTKVNFSIFGGYHEKTDQTFKLTFYNAANQPVGTGDVAVVDWDVDLVPSGRPILKQYFLSGTAPSGVSYVRVEAIKTKGDWFKVDAACVEIEVPPVACCDVNMLKNGSFEEYKTITGDIKVPTNWEYSANAKFTWDGGYPVCGSKNGLLTGAGDFWQDVLITPGSKATLTIWGGYHVQSGQTFKIQFVSQTGVVTDGDFETLNKRVEDLPRTSNKGMTQYTLEATAPAGTKYVRIFGTATGNYLKVDAACLSITVPPCETCANNVVQNPNFESLSNWNKVVGTFETSDEYVVCGSLSGKLTGKTTVNQRLEVAQSSTVTFSIYAGYDVNTTPKITLRFLQANEEVLSFTDQAIDKVLTASPGGLKKFTVTAKAPVGTKYVVVEVSSQGGNKLIIDLACVTVVPPDPLPVTLVDFKVKKEGSSAAISWSTSVETNSKEFEVQHSLNGKQWAVLDVVAAQGESLTTKSYSYTHANPSNGNNLYRLRMIDLDATFAFSRIVSENFVTAESAVLYPNPSSNVMKLQSGNEIANIQIYDVRGIKVRDFAPKSTDIDISSLAQGTYIVTFKQTNGITTKQRIQVIR